METEREELIPGPPGIRLPQIEISVGKWFWLGLATLVASIGCAIASLHGWGPPAPLQPTGALDGANGLTAFLAANPTVGWSFLYVFGLLNPGQVMIASIVLLWIAFARPGSPDRVAFIPAVTLTAWILANLAGWLQNTFGGHVPIFNGGVLVSYAAAVSLAGCSSIALAARGLRPVPRTIVWPICALAFSMDVVFQIFVGTPPLSMLGSLLLGMAVLAFGFEVAEKSGAELFTFDDRSDLKPDPIVHLRIATYVLLGCAGVGACLAIGHALALGWIPLSPEFAVKAFVGQASGGLIRVAAYILGATLGGAFVWSPIAVLALWVAFARPDYSERLLFAAGTILGAIFLFPNVDELLRGYAGAMGHANVDAVLGYPNLPAAYSVVVGSVVFVGARGFAHPWRRAAEIIGVAIPTCVVGGFFIAGFPPIHLLGGLILGASGVVLALAIARRAGIDLFARSQADADA